MTSDREMHAGVDSFARRRLVLHRREARRRPATPRA